MAYENITGNTDHFTVSVIIPVHNDETYLNSILVSLSEQTLLPYEVIIIDSSSNNNICVNELNLDVVPYVHYKKVDFAYPGQARNIGAAIAKGEWLGFIDSRTIPERYWLEKCASIVKENNSDFVGGLTLFEAENSFQEFLRATSYGYKAYKTLPGSIVKTSCFENTGGFIESVRSSEDIEWISRIKSLGYRIAYLKDPIVKYYGLPASFLPALKKYFRYAMSTAHTDIFIGQKWLYLSVLFVLLTILVYKWNSIIASWNLNESLYIPHITKAYFMTLIFFFIFLKGVAAPRIRGINLGVFEKVYLIILLCLASGLFHRWNFIFAGFDVNSLLYIPHVTKIYIGSLFLAVIIFRGVIRPIMRDVNLRYLLPFRWIIIGLLGLCLDIVKAPGYCLGAVLEIMGKTDRK